jgi:hypothetical protein
VLGLGRLLFIDEAPDTFKEVLAHDAGQQAPGDTDGHEQELGHSPLSPLSAVAVRDR